MISEKMKVIIYAKGQLFEKYEENIAWENVVAIADKKAEPGERCHGCPVITPIQIMTTQYDYIAIFSNKLFEQIKNELIGEYFVEEEKIVSWKVFLKETKYETGKAEFLEQFIRNKKIKSVLDTRIEDGSRYSLNKYESVGDELVRIDGIGEEKYQSYKRIYDMIYPNVQLCKNTYYDLVVFWSWADDIANILKNINSRYILCFTPYLLLGEKNIGKCYNEMKGFGKVYRFSRAEGIVWLVDRSVNECQWDETKIYVVTHKKYNLPKDNLYVPLVVGDKYLEHAYLSEQKGSNIAYLNDKINECTALYWIWKNTDSKYIGMCHYRRRFYNDWNMNSGNYLDLFHIKEILGEYDIILPVVRLQGDKTIREQLRQTMDEDAFIKGYEIIKEKIAKYQPEYINIFEDAMNLYSLFVCNMFVTRREILNEYCEWLFSFLIEAAEEIDVSTYDGYSKRVMGFFAERMWTVWLMNKNLKIKELAITEV